MPFLISTFHSSIRHPTRPLERLFSCISGLPRTSRLIRSRFHAPVLHPASSAVSSSRPCDRFASTELPCSSTSGVWVSLEIRTFQLRCYPVTSGRSSLDVDPFRVCSSQAQMVRSHAVLLMLTPPRLPCGSLGLAFTSRSPFRRAHLVRVSSTPCLAGSSSPFPTFRARVLKSIASSSGVRVSTLTSCPGRLHSAASTDTSPYPSPILGFMHD